MPTEEKVREELDAVLVPGVRRSLNGLNLLRDINVSEQKVKIVLASSALSQKARDWLRDKVRESIGKLPEVEDVEVVFEEVQPKEINSIRYVVAVMSGKGGVGKSLVAALLASALRRKGYEVGIMDADITGPSIPKMFNLSSRPSGSDTGILPVLSRSGIEIMSINLLLSHEDDAVIWRGPLIGKTIQQFWGDVLWGSLDYLIVDLPPGTADAPLTVMQSIPVSGVVIVSTPQDLATMVVRKAVKMARDSMHIPILGVVENMSYFPMPGSGERVELFGKSRGEEMARAAGAPLLGQIPVDPELARLCDEGEVERYDSEVVKGIIDSFIQAIGTKEE